MRNEKKKMGINFLGWWRKRSIWSEFWNAEKN